MTTTATRLPSIGNVVRLRQRTWLVEDVIVEEPHATNPLVRLACFDDDAQGEVLTVLWGIERNPEIIDNESWQQLGEDGFDDPQKFSAFLHTMRWNCITSTDPKLYQSPFRAGIRLDAYQLEPLDKALQMPRVNLFIADDVGLGKTIEAGLILSELLLRRRIKDVVVAAPPNMLIQWQEEMESRFGLRFEILDRAYIERVRQDRGYAVNPWTTFPRFLVSHKLLIDETYVAPLRDWMGSLKTHSLLILDEAHHAAPASGSKYAIDSQFTRAIRDLASRFEHRLFLSATPHNGHSNSFSALLEILDPLRFTRGVKVIKKHVEDAIVRRLKEDIRQVQGGGFPIRQVKAWDLKDLPETQPELVLGRLLDEYRTLRTRRMAQATRKQQTQFQLLLSNLQQRLFSSVTAFHRTITVHRRTMEKLWAREALTGAGTPDWRGLAALNDPEDDRSTLGWEEQNQLEDEVFAAASQASSLEHDSPEGRERELLEEMEKVAYGAKDEPDARVRRIFQFVDETLRSGEAWNRERLIIFTEYEDTRRYLVKCLKDHYLDDPRSPRIEFYSGITNSVERERIKHDFNSDPETHTLRVLVATDAAREGLNLQSRCHHLVHFDIPWNPGRLEQRNGRIDRKMQPAPEVFCWYFKYAQRPEDRILDTLVRKTETIHKELGSLSQILEPKMTLVLKDGIRRQDIDTLEKQLVSVDKTELDKAALDVAAEELESLRHQEKLKASLGSLESKLESSRKVMGLDERHLRDSIDCSLSLLHIGGMERKPEADGSVSYRFPDLARQRGADPSWESTLSALRPRTPDQAPVSGELLPVVFQAPDENDANVIQLHLEHKLVKRLLGRFLSQGFLYKDLSRACLVKGSDTIPRVALVGRLSVFGAGALRLHEQLVAVTARWVPQDKRATEGLRVFAEDGEGTTLVQLEEALAPGNTKTPTEAQSRACAATLADDVRALLPALESRATQALDQARRLLLDRGYREAEALVKLLDDQKQRVLRTMDEDDRNNQLLLGFSEADERQYRENRKYWDTWLKDAEEKRRTEPDKIRQFYTSASFRIEPVGIAYLMPQGQE